MNTNSKKKLLLKMFDLAEDSYILTVPFQSAVICYFGWTI